MQRTVKSYLPAPTPLMVPLLGRLNVFFRRIHKHTPMSTSYPDFTLTYIDGTKTTLAAYRGKVLLIVNVASKCGLTPQYTGLDYLYRRMRHRGFDLLGFPTNDFNEQEPGSNSEIQAFCTLNYDVHFPLFSKISVLGADQDPLYAYLTTSIPAAIGDGPLRERLRSHGVTTSTGADVLWNFEKFVLNRDGKVVARFAPDVTPDDPRIIETIESQ
jgi:glutathione peroxidase